MLKIALVSFLFVALQDGPKREMGPAEIRPREPKPLEKRVNAAVIPVYVSKDNKVAATSNVVPVDILTKYLVKSEQFRIVDAAAVKAATEALTKDPKAPHPTPAQLGKAVGVPYVFAANVLKDEIETRESLVGGRARKSATVLLLQLIRVSDGQVLSSMQSNGTGERGLKPDEKDDGADGTKDAAITADALRMAIVAIFDALVDAVPSE